MGVRSCQSSELLAVVVEPVAEQAVAAFVVAVAALVVLVQGHWDQLLVLRTGRPSWSSCLCRTLSPVLSWMRERTFWHTSRGQQSH